MGKRKKGSLLRAGRSGFPALNRTLKDPTSQEDILPRKPSTPRQHPLQGEPPPSAPRELAGAPADKVSMPVPEEKLHQGMKTPLSSKSTKEGFMV